MFDEAHQPRLADLVEKGLDVAIEHPVDTPPADPERERIQRLVLIALRSEPVAEPQELRLIDRRQDCHHRRLDDLVLQGSDAERPLPAIWLRNISPTRWQRSIRSCLDAFLSFEKVKRAREATPQSAREGSPQLLRPVGMGSSGNQSRP